MRISYLAQFWENNLALGAWQSSSPIWLPAVGDIVVFGKLNTKRKYVVVKRTFGSDSENEIQVDIDVERA